MKKIGANPLALIFLLLVLSEFIYKICIKEHWHEFKISAGLKTLLQLFFVVQIARSNYKKLIPIVLLVIIFMLGQVGWVPLGQFIKNTWFLDKYLFVLLVLTYVSTISGVKQYYPLLFQIFEIFMVLNSIFIVIGFVFDLDYFSTYYGHGKRFGLNGMILRSGASTYIYWIALFYFFTACFVKRRKKYWQLIIVLLASLLIGTKAMFIAYFFLGVLLLLLFRKHKNKWWLLAIALAGIVGAYFFKDALEWVMLQSPSLRQVYNERGLFSAVVSLRDQHLFEEMLPLIREKWTWRNYLFGGGYNMHYRSQFGMLDLFYFFGIVGTMAYLFIFGKLFCTFKKNLVTVTFIIGTFVLMAFSANFFYETILAFYLVVVKGYFENEKNKT
ncbi:hypothetical protein [Marinirhabdus gelatinilytica]|uniref:hypothetical protein n=1 Tax=Marinirhabdus gelatinilytica TaxID=1703343 RepID=UPI0011C063D1|nr:hypothetical protein [Marinirhabdus gelatinilytica]